jgi:hypothetical protein
MIEIAPASCRLLLLLDGRNRALESSAPLRVAAARQVRFKDREQALGVLSRRIAGAAVFVWHLRFPKSQHSGCAGYRTTKTGPVASSATGCRGGFIVVSWSAVAARPQMNAVGLHVSGNGRVLDDHQFLAF